MRQFRPILALLAATALSPVAAHAADLPSRKAPVFAATPAPTVIVLETWSGFYDGNYVGYMSTRARVRQPGGGRDSYETEGILGSRSIGYDQQFGNVVIGAEAEIGINETKGTLRSGSTTGAQGDHLWQAGVRGRLGYSFGSVLPFVSGGFTASQFHQHSVFNFADGDVNTHYGYQVGGGIDVEFTRRFVGRFEYVFQDYGSRNYIHDATAHRVGLTTHMIRGALIVRETPGLGTGGSLRPGIGGFHTGVLGGYAVADATFKNRSTGGRTDVDLDGGQFGLFGGADIHLADIPLGYIGLTPFSREQVGGAFLGFDTSIQIPETRGQDVGPGGGVGVDMLWTSNFRGRLGTSFGAISPYVAGGFAISQARTTLDQGAGFAQRRTAVDPLYGYTLGGGVDYAISNRVFGRAEYLYSNFSDSKIKLGRFPVDRMEVDRHEVRFGLGYRLSD